MRKSLYTPPPFPLKPHTHTHKKLTALCKSFFFFIRYEGEKGEHWKKRKKINGSFLSRASYRASLSSEKFIAIGTVSMMKWGWLFHRASSFSVIQMLKLVNNSGKVMYFIFPELWDLCNFPNTKWWLIDR